MKSEEGRGKCIVHIRRKTVRRQTFKRCAARHFVLCCTQRDAPISAFLFSLPHSVAWGIPKQVRDDGVRTG